MAIAASFVLMAASCQKESSSGETAPQLELEKTTVEFTAQAGEQTIGFSANERPSAVKNGDWLTVSVNYSDGKGSITVKVAANEKTAERTAAVSVVCGSLKKSIDVRQAAKEEEPAPPSGKTELNPAKELHNGKATPEAKALYAKMLSHYGKKTISGAMGGTAWETSYCDYIANAAGEYPAIVGFDYLFSNWPPKAWDKCPDYADITPVKKASDAGSIIQIGWHWCVPEKEGETDLNNYSFNTKKFSVRRALTEGTWEHDMIDSQIEKVASYMKHIADAKIPVLFRPLHEAAGDYTWGAWFWWGNDGAEACRELWVYLHDKLTGEYGLNNLIWVWTAQTSNEGKLAGADQLKEWYPGDEYVDIVGADLYPDTKWTTQTEAFNLVNNSVDGGKMIVLSEFGNMLDFDKCFKEDAPWGYFMNWCDTDENGSPKFFGNNTAADWKTVLEGSNILNRGDL